VRIEPGTGHQPAPFCCCTTGLAVGWTVELEYSFGWGEIGEISLGEMDWDGEQEYVYLGCTFCEMNWLLLEGP
jgi:hypothetical protein